MTAAPEDLNPAEIVEQIIHQFRCLHRGSKMNGNRVENATHKLSLHQHSTDTFEAASVLTAVGRPITPAA